MVKNILNPDQCIELAKILPPDTADFWWTKVQPLKMTGYSQAEPEGEPYYTFSLSKNQHYGLASYEEIPCWGLASLLDILTKKAREIDEDGAVDISSYKGNTWLLGLNNCDDRGHIEGEELIDLCYKKIIELYQDKLKNIE